MMATGHYARIAQCGQSGQPQLLRGVDPLKDQSYFLASVHGSSLAGDVAHAWLWFWACCTCMLPENALLKLLNLARVGSPNFLAYVRR